MGRELLTNPVEKRRWAARTRLAPGGRVFHTLLPGSCTSRVRSSQSRGKLYACLESRKLSTESGQLQLVNAVYGHLGTIGHRTEVVEYRADRYLDTMGDRIADLRAGLTVEALS